MELTFLHAESIGICFAILLILLILEYMNRREQEFKKAILPLYLSEMLLLAIDMICIMIDKNAEMALFHKIIRSAYMMACPLFSWLWLNYCETEVGESRKWLERGSLVLVIGNAVFVIVSWFFGFLFTINEEGTFVRGPWAPVTMGIMYGIVIASEVHSLMMSYQAKTLTDRRMAQVRALCTLPLVLMGVIQLVYLPGISFIHFGFVFTALLEFAISQRNKITEDAITGLLTQSAIDRKILNTISHQRDNDSIFLVACDLDAFKSINDEFGHAIGDEALALTGRVFTEVCAAYNCVPARLHGDEFVIFCEKRTEDEVRQMLEEIDKRLRDESDKVSYRVCFSYGIAKYVPGMTAKALSEVADNNLYAQKRAKFGDKARGRAEWR